MAKLYAYFISKPKHPTADICCKMFTQARQKIKSFSSRTYSHSRKTVNTRKNLWNVYCFVTNQKREETTKGNRQTAACTSHDVIRNNELAFSSNNLAFLPRLTFKNQTTEFGIDVEVKFTTVQVFLLSYKKIRIENHQLQPANMTH